MATTNYQFRLIVRPTALGQAIVSRLEAPGVDRTGEARRWLELGFAAEQAGFRMDHLELRHGDKAWTVQPTIIPVHAPPTDAPSASVASTGSSHTGGEGQGATATAPPPAVSLAARQAAVAVEVTAPVTAPAPLLNSLRSLSST